MTFLKKIQKVELTSILSRGQRLREVSETRNTDLKGASGHGKVGGFLMDMEC